MARKSYMSPFLIATVVGDGDIGITDSQEGVIGGGEVASSILDVLHEWGIDDTALQSLGLNPADLGSWSIRIPGFNANDSSTWEIATDYIISQLYPEL